MQVPEPVRYRNKDTQSGSGMLLYRTEMIDAGLPMPAASALMPIPSYVIMFCKEITAFADYHMLNLINID
jgi:hypothetical protein